MNSEFYPDVVAAGGLAAALEQSAAGLGEPPLFVPGRKDIPGSVGIATTTPARLPLVVFQRTENRAFQVLGRAGGVEIVSGVTRNLEDVVEAGAAWSTGVTVARMRETLRFLEFDPIAEAHERGPAAAVAAQWDLLREKAVGTPRFSEFGSLIEAAHAEPRLRQLFPFISHWTIAFSSCTGRPYREEIAISPQYGGGPYIVLRHTNTGVYGEVRNAAEAVALALDHLSDSAGPAVAGFIGRSD
ncbi:DUF6193 family natural product biosynthesis protein [Streptomyces sp. NPDC060187]|uniref:DUF6193 family natural product biosynthesis protein n=1 Tax=Streptomyces sp. NPDC060187 TaxID=3347067 RepID=UPI00364D363C